MSDQVCELLCLDLHVAERIRARSLRRATEFREAADRARGFADPTRLSVAAALADAEELCVCDLSWISGRSQNLVSHHLRVLRTAGLVNSRRLGKMVMYSLTEDGRSLLASVLPIRVTA